MNSNHERLFTTVRDAAPRDAVEPKKQSTAGLEPGSMRVLVSLIVAAWAVIAIAIWAL